MSETITVESQFETIKKSMAELRELVEKGSQPSYGFHNSHDGMAMSYFADDNSPPTRYKAMNARQFERRLPEGYKPFTIWKTLGSYLREGILAHNLDRGGGPTRAAEFAQKYHGILKTIQGMSSVNGADGGFGVLPEFAPTIHDRIFQNDIFSRCDGYTVTSDRMAFPRSAETSRADGSRAGGVRGYWTAQGGTVTASSPTIAETELRLKKLMVVVYLTNELINDNAYALQQWVTRKVTEEIQFMLGNAVFNGTGAGMPLGFRNSAAAISVAAEAGQGADTILAQNIVNMWSRRLANTPMDGWAWYLHQTVEAQLQLMFVATGATGGLCYMPPTGLSGSPYGTLYGLPIVPVEFAPTLGDAGDISLANLKEYVTITKGGVTEATSTEVEFLSDQLALRFTLRVDGRPYDDAPITPYAAGATTPPTQSAFITLASR